MPKNKDVVMLDRMVIVRDVIDVQIWIFCKVALCIFMMSALKYFGYSEFNDIVIIATLAWLLLSLSRSKIAYDKCIKNLKTKLNDEDSTY